MQINITLPGDKLVRSSVYYSSAKMPEETSPHLLLGTQDQWLGAEQDQLPCGPTGTSFGSCQEMDICMVQLLCIMPVPPKPFFRSPWRAGNDVVGRRNAGWTTSKSGNSLPMPELLIMTSCRKEKKKLEKDLCWIAPHVPLTTPSGEWTGLNWSASVLPQPESWIQT